MTLLIIFAKLLLIGSPVFSTELKSFSMSLMRSSSSLSSPSFIMWPHFVLAMWGAGYQQAYQSGHLTQTRYIGTIHPPLVVDGVHMWLLHVSYFSTLRWESLLLAFLISVSPDYCHYFYSPLHGHWPL